uniref:Uncharacterized protein n=1 Tax=Triatoma dimidiata TaxID=72491 RepID=A0A0V0GDG6_TRIDM
MDRFPTIKSVFCLTLETAAKVVAYTHLIGFGFIFLLYFSFKTTNDLQDYGTSLIRISYTVMHNIMQENALLLSAFFAGALIIGIRKKNSDLVLSWLLLQISTLLISVVTLPVTLVPHLIRGNYIWINLQVIAFIILKSFAFLVVNSYYLTLSRGNLISEEEEISTS